MNDAQLNPLKTGMLFVAPGQIMDHGIMKLPHYPNHLSRLKADVGLDTVGAADLAPAARPSWSLHQLLDRIGEFFYRQGPASTKCPGQIQEYYGAPSLGVAVGPAWRS
jgi:hypothetical protein